MSFLKHKKIKLLAVTISGAILKTILWKRVPFNVNYQVIQERFGQAHKEIQFKVVATPYKLECFATQKKLRSYYQRAT
eukprot:UN27249